LSLVKFYCIALYIKTQLNTNTEERSSESLYKCPILKKKQSILFLNNSVVPQLINHAGKLFHASITLIVKKNIPGI